MDTMRDACEVDEKATMMASCLVAEWESVSDSLMVACLVVSVVVW